MLYEVCVLEQVVHAAEADVVGRSVMHSSASVKSERSRVMSGCDMLEVMQSEVSWRVLRGCAVIVTSGLQDSTLWACNSVQSEKVLVAVSICLLVSHDERVSAERI